MQEEEVFNLVTDTIGPMNEAIGLLPIILPFLIGTALIVSLLALLSTISRLRSQKATVTMQKDIRIIREIVEREYANKQPIAARDDPQLPPKP